MNANRGYILSPGPVVISWCRIGNYSEAHDVTLWLYYCNNGWVYILFPECKGQPSRISRRGLFASLSNWWSWEVGVLEQICSELVRYSTSWKNLMPMANACTEQVSQEHRAKFDISLSSQKEIQLVEISQRLCVAISWNTFNYCIMSFLAFSQNLQSMQRHSLFLRLGL